MSQRRWRVGVVGCGAIAWPHLDHLGRLAAARRVELVGVCDQSLATARFAAGRSGALAACTSVDELLDRVAPDVVHVLTPPHTHEDVSVRCLAAGAHVLCEKPATPDRAALERVLAAATAAGRRFAESQNLRWNDPVVSIRSAVELGQLGDVRDIDLLLALDLAAGPLGAPGLAGPAVHLPGGAVHDLLPHLVYLFVHLAGAPLEQQALMQTASIAVLGHLRNQSGNDRLGFDHLDVTIDAPPLRGRIRVAGDLEPSGFRVTVRGTAGSIETDLYHPYLRVETGSTAGLRGVTVPLATGSRMAWSGVTGLVDKVRRHDVFHGLGRLLDAWYSALDDDTEPPVTPVMMRATAALTDRIVGLREQP